MLRPLLVSVLFAAGCASPGRPLETGQLRPTGFPKTITYDVALVEVRRPQETRDRWGAVDHVTQGASGKYIYGDSLMTAAFVVSMDRITLLLSNHTDHSLKIVWDEAAFVDLNGNVSRVMHEGVRYVARNESQPASMVPAGSTISDELLPVSKVVETRSDFLHDPLIEPVRAESAAGLETAEAKKGKRFTVVLPIEVAGVVNEYTFVFEIQAVRSS